MPVSAGAFFCAGDERKCNWLLVRHAPGARRCVVFFPGDISDFAAGNAPYSYSLEALLWVLCGKFPDETVIVVKPHMMVNFFAIYVNFMLVDGMGNPRPLPDDHKDEGTGSDDAAMGADGGSDAGRGEDAEPPVQPPRATAHLEKLLGAAERELGEALPGALALVGFSKGAAVLNALLRESTSEAAFWGRVEAVHYLDAGLNVPGIFPARPEALRGLSSCAREGFAVWLHSTPRQLEDPRRPFIAEEARAFAERCEAAGLRVERRTYGEGRPQSLDMHFDTVRCFLTHDGDLDSGDQHCGFFEAWAAAAEGA